MPRKPTANRPLRWGHGSVVERAPGRWQARWTDHTGARRAMTFADEESAYDHLRTVAADQASGRYLPPEQLHLATVLRRWLDRHAPTVKPSTAATYRHEIERNVIPALGRESITALTAHRLQQQIDRWHRDGLSRETLAKRLTVLKVALDECVLLQLIPVNPARYVKLPRIVKPPLVVWSAGEAARMLAAAAGDGPMWHAFYLLALTTGMRPGELRALRWADIDLGKQRLTVSRTITRDADRIEVAGTSTKTSRPRAIALRPDVVAVLRAWKSAQSIVSIDGYLFTTRSGRFISGGQLADSHRRLVTAAGLPYITPHGLRHTAASLLLEINTHPKIVADLLGHSAIATTIDTYSHVDESMQREALDRLAALLTLSERNGA